MINYREPAQEGLAQPAAADGQVSRDKSTQQSPTAPEPRLQIQCEPIAVKWSQATRLLNMSGASLSELRPKLIEHGMLHYREWYDVQSMRKAFAKLCKEEMGQTRNRQRGRRR